MPRRQKKFRPAAPRRRGGDWSSESCVVLTCASVYRRLEDSAPLAVQAEAAGSRMSDALDLWSPSEAGSRLPELSCFHKAERLVKSESEDSGVEMGSTENSVFTPLGSTNSIQQEEGSTGSPTSSSAEPRSPSPAPDPLSCSLTASTKLKQVMQRSKRLGGAERTPGRLPPFSVTQKHSGSLPSLSSELLPGREGGAPARQRRRPSFSCRTLSDDPDMLGMLGRREWGEQHRGETEEEDENPQALPGPGLRYLEHVCQMLEKIAYLQQYNLQLQQQRVVLKTQNLGSESERTEPGSHKGREFVTAPSTDSVRGAVTPPDSGRILETCVPGDVGQLWTLQKALPPHLPLDLTQGAQNPCEPWHSLGTSVSSTGVYQDPYKIPDMESSPSLKAPVPYTCSLSLQDEGDGPDPTFLPPAKHKNEVSQWDKVKAMITKLARKTSPEPLGHAFSDPWQVLCMEMRTSIYFFGSEVFFSLAVGFLLYLNQTLLGSVATSIFFHNYWGGVRRFQYFLTFSCPL
ncbi:uncharacterized protein C8orf58 homolog isoform X2 [Rhinatrema bivittatum]|uniref:uncharacterized protein C8orf58 homolog isoform X2 n=1 Tax=Rhinatrema bivittatum TaxID=194408 RepID=UPI00112853D2|nr:uncharacterized protein C8orf58 homolog isoform X2 [Rhinatrema bivittatum]